MNEENVFGKRMKALREKKLISADDLGKALGKDRATIYRYESGKIVPAYSVIVKIANALNTSTDYLLGTTDNEKITLNTILESSGVYTSAQDALMRLFETDNDSKMRDELFELTERELSTIKNFIKFVPYLTDDDLEMIDLMIKGFAERNKSKGEKE